MLLVKKGVSFEDIDVAGDADRLKEMQDRSGGTTVPQIFIDERHVGGYDDMAELDAMGQLDPMLGLVPAVIPGAAAHTLDASEDAPT